MNLQTYQGWLYCGKPAHRPLYYLYHPSGKYHQIHFIGKGDNWSKHLDAWKGHFIYITGNSIGDRLLLMQEFKPLFFY